MNIFAFIASLFQWFVNYVFNPVFFHPILNLLVGLYKLILNFHIPGAFGWSLILLVVLVRIVLHPFFKQQLVTSKRMQKLKPQLDKLAAKYKSDPRTLQMEQMKLYQQYGVNPAAGCLVMILQIPIFIALYRTLYTFLTNGVTPKVIADINHTLYFPFLKLTTIDPQFFIFNLVQSPAKAHVWYYYLVPVITAALQLIQAQFAPMTPAPQSTVPVKDKDGKEVVDSSAEFQKAMNTQMKYLFPLMLGWFSYTLPVGLSLYYNIFSIFSIIQYRQVHKIQEEGEKSQEVGKKEARS